MRRLAKVMRQFDLTCDFHDMTRDQIFDLLPPEFDKYKKAAKSSEPAESPV